MGYIGRPLPIGFVHPFISQTFTPLIWANDIWIHTWVNNLKKKLNTFGAL
jgi:hypothetical protein